MTVRCFLKSDKKSNYYLKLDIWEDLISNNSEIFGSSLKYPT